MRDTDGYTVRDLPAKSAIEVAAGELDVLATLAEGALINSGVPIYQRGRRLVRPATQEIVASKGRMTVSACLADVTLPAMIDYLARAATFSRFDARTKQPRTIDPPKQIAETLLSRFGEWRFPQISGVITSPTLRPDHSILSIPGFDPRTRLYLAADSTLVLPPVPAFPTEADAEEALALLDGLLTGFPFVSPLDRSVALSALLTTVCRGAMPVAPLHVFRASTAGTGKSYLADLAAAISTGRPCPVASTGKSAAETESRLTGLILAGFPVVSLDNINGELDSDLLAQAVERPLLRLRRLGSSEIYEVETRATFLATGNALQVCSDLTRRTLICDLDAQMERPELRTFAFDPVARVLADRGPYVAAALTVVRAYVVARESVLMPTLGSYEDYSATVRGALIWLGHPDPAASMERAREDDPVLSQLRSALTAWHASVNGEKTVKQLRDIAEADPTGDFNQALLAVASGKHGLDANALGRWMRSKKGRIVSITPDDRSGHIKVKLVTAGETSGATRWALQVCGRGG